MPNLRFHKYLPLALIYFFINVPPFFPSGLLVTRILSPAFYFWLLLKHRRFVIEGFLVVMFPFAFANAIQGMKISDFVPSFLLFFTVYITVYTFAVAVNEMRNLDHLIRTLIWLNLILAIIGLAVRFTHYVTFMWMTPEDSSSTTLRFKGFTSEPSLYSTLLTPLFLYSYWLVARKRNWYTVCLFLATSLPLLMSLSYGTIGGLTISLLTVYLVGGRGFTRYKWILAIGVVAAVGYLALPSSNPIKARVVNMITGNDGSEQIRTSASYLAAYGEAKSKDIWFGAGLGETKDIGRTYMNWDISSSNPHLASAIAETFGEMGILGLALRFFLEFFFFFRTKPYKDPYRLSLFIWIFVFQFGGSFKDNLGEYVIWILAFSKSAGFFSTPEPAAEAELPMGIVPQLT